MMVQRIESIEGEMRGLVTYDLGNGRRASFDARAVCEYGVAALLRSAGVEAVFESGRLPVIQDGRTVGYLPAAFDPHAIRSRTFLYDPRPGDFRRDGDQWIANKMLGPGDLEAIPGFAREQD